MNIWEMVIIFVIIASSTSVVSAENAGTLSSNGSKTRWLSVALAPSFAQVEVGTLEDTKITKVITLT